MILFTNKTRKFVTLILDYEGKSNNNHFKEYDIPKRMNKTIINRIKKLIWLKESGKSNNNDEDEDEKKERDESKSSKTSKLSDYKTPRSEPLKIEEIKDSNSFKIISGDDSYQLKEDMFQSVKEINNGIIYEINGIICQFDNNSKKEFKVFTVFEK